MLRFHEVGKGEAPVLLLHGFLGSGRNLRTLARRWSERRPDLRFVLPDLTGHGESPPLPPMAGLDVLAGDVLDLARHLGLPRPLRALGHSMGGRVALAAARVEPGAMGWVTLLDIRPGPLGSEESPVMQRLLAAPDEVARREDALHFLKQGGIPDAVARWLAMNLVHEGETYRWRIDREALAELLGRMGADDLWPVIEGRELSVRCIRGGASPYVSDADVERFRAVGVPVDTIQEAGHFVHVDAPEALIGLLAQDGP